METDKAIRAMFDDCDDDGNNRISTKEMAVCIKNAAPAELRDKIDAKYYLTKYDQDRNGYLSFSEFYEAVKPSEDAQFEVKMSDGTTKLLSQKELTERTLSSTKGMRYEDGKLVKDEDGKSSIDEIIKSNPQMARFIIMGNWTCGVLNQTGAIPGRLQSIKTLPRSGEGSSTAQTYEEYMPSQRSFEIRLLLTIKAKSKERVIEAIVGRDPVNYPKPYLYVVEAYYLKKNGDRGEQITVPEFRKITLLNRVASVVGSTEYWLIMAGAFLLLAVAFIFKLMFFSANIPVELHEKKR